MKATEYAAKFLQDRKENKMNACAALYAGLKEELLAVAEARKCERAGAWLSLFREFNSKWLAIREICAELRKKGFVEFVDMDEDLSHQAKHCAKVFRLRHWSND